MEIESRESKRWVTLAPGEIYATNKELIITTLLGSCVSVCLYDPIHKIFGMNHFLLADQYYPQSLPFYLRDGGRYGVHAMELLINKMLQLGADKKHIKAKAFGGGNVLNSDNKISSLSKVGDINVQFILVFLDKESIPLVSSDLGGDSGRIIRFDTKNQAVFVRKIPKIRLLNIETKERKYWENTILDQKLVKSYDVWLEKKYK